MMNYEDAAAVPMINGWVEIVKRFIPDRFHRFLPLAAMAFGVLYAFAIKPGKVENPIERGMVGLVLGLTAAGAFEGARHLLAKPAAPKA